MAASHTIPGDENSFSNSKLLGSMLPNIVSTMQLVNLSKKMYHVSKTFTNSSLKYIRHICKDPTFADISNRLHQMVKCPLQQPLPAERSMAA
jgi:hypothetical protein